MNRGARLSRNELFVPEVVCFADIPIDELRIHMVKYSEFGIAFPKHFLLTFGACPVLYVPTTARVGPRNLQLEERPTMAAEFDRMAQEFDRLIVQDGFARVDSAEVMNFRDLAFFLVHRIFSHIKAFDPMLAEDDPSNYYMEREWRVLGYVRFTLQDISRVIVPSTFLERAQCDLDELQVRIQAVPERGEG
jgi:hypothetical protein